MMPEPLETNTEPSSSPPSERSQVLRDFGKDFFEGKGESSTDEDSTAAETPREYSDDENSPQSEGNVGERPGKSPRDGKTGQFKAQPKSEPFEGFSDLPEAAQERFRRLTGDLERTRQEYSAVAGRLGPMQNAIDSMRVRLQQPNQTNAERTAKVDAFLNSDKWKNFQARYPEDADGVADALRATAENLRTEFNNSSQPLNDKIERLESRLGELDAKERIAHARGVISGLDETHPEWRQIAGWVDNDGNTVSDMAKRVWHPWFTAWKETLPTHVRKGYENVMDHSTDVDSIRYVLDHFKSAVEQAQRDQGYDPNAEPADDLTQRREQALRDPSPRPSRPGAESVPHTFERGGEPTNRTAILDRFYTRFKAGQSF
jgi:hypothetical protein